MGAKVVPLFKDARANRPAMSREFEQAWLAYPESGRLRSSKKLSLPEWSRVASEIGEPDLLVRVRRYASEDKDHRKECGAPGFHRWLKWGRWEHWAPIAPRLVEAPKFFDPALRAAFAASFADEKARRWFDRCELTDDRTLVAPPARSEWIYGPFAAWAKSHDIKGIRFK